MNRPDRLPYLAAGLILFCGFLLLALIFAPGVVRLIFAPPTSTPDFAATLQALIPTLTPSPASFTPRASPASDAPNGQIVFTCQIYKYQSSEQICIMNADGSGYRRLTTEDGVRHYYPSLAPDGRSVVYSVYREDNIYEIYELTLADGKETRLTDKLGVLTGPEVSPDGTSMVFMRWTVASNQYQIWIMDRDGRNPRRIFSGTGWDPTWSPDGTQILFASDMNGSNQLYIVNLNGVAVHKITNLPALRGRSDWSPHGRSIVTYSGEPWQREVYILDADGSNVRQLTPSGGNSQGPTFSRDGKWVAFTAYFDHPGDINGCEIYIIRVNGMDLRRLTNNDYCDYQPRWGP
jgi:Tol biopolymer transport system component